MALKRVIATFDYHITTDFLVLFLAADISYSKISLLLNTAFRSRPVLPCLSVSPNRIVSLPITDFTWGGDSNFIAKTIKFPCWSWIYWHLKGSSIFGRMKLPNKFNYWNQSSHLKSQIGPILLLFMFSFESDTPPLDTYFQLSVYILA